MKYAYLSYLTYLFLETELTSRESLQVFIQQVDSSSVDAIEMLLVSLLSPSITFGLDVAKLTYLKM